MNNIQPLNTRYRVQSLGAQTEIIIPAQRSYFTLLFLLVWLAGWAVGEVSVSGLLLRSLLARFAPQLIQGGASLALPEMAFTLFWLIFWTLGGAWVLYVVLWQLFGRERLILEYGRLRLRQEVLGLGRERVYETTRIADLRVEPPRSTRNALPRGTLCFAYEGRTVCFGRGLRVAEAEQLLDDLRRYAPSLAERVWG